jgi:hypothetical protein
MIRILNLLIAEIAVIIAVEMTKSSPLPMFVPANYLYVLTVIPIILLLFGRNPFDFPLFAVLVMLLSSKVLANSEIFYSSLDAIYFLGYKNLAEYLETIFSVYKSTSDIMGLSALVVLYSVSQIIWVMAKKSKDLKRLGMNVNYQIAVLGITALAIYLFYPALIAPQSLEIPLLFLGLIGVVLVILAMYLLT